MDCENQEKDKDGNPSTTGSFNNSNTNNSECYIHAKAWNTQTTCFPGFTSNHSQPVLCSACSHILEVRTPVYMCFFCVCNLKIFSLWCLCSFTGIQTIDSTQALFLPIGASVSLLVMFFFFDSVQVVFTICTAGNCSSRAHHDNTTAVEWTIHISCSVVALRGSPLLYADYWNCKDH